MGWDAGDILWERRRTETAPDGSLVWEKAPSGAWRKTGKTCPSCERWFPRSGYYPNGRDGGMGSKCSECTRHRTKKWAADNPDRKKDADLRRNYNISLDQYDKMLARQGGGCAVCGATEAENGRSLAVDHDHACCPDTKKSCGKCVRGLLCNNCNRCIGWAKDDIARLERMADYLRLSAIGADE